MNIYANNSKLIHTNSGQTESSEDTGAKITKSGSSITKEAATEVLVTAAHYRGEAILRLGKNRRINSRLVSLRKPNSVEAGRYHRLRHTVESIKPDNGGVVIGITSSLAGEGRTLTAINLAGALAQHRGARVLLVDLDVRESEASVKDYLGIRKATTLGLVDWVSNSQLNWEEAAHFIPDFNLYFMPPGRVAESPYELLTSPRFGMLLTEARQRYDYIILDAAPVLPVPDSQLISDLVDGFMVIVAADNTSKKTLEDALNLIAPDKVLGLIFNGCSSLDGDTQSY